MSYTVKVTGLKEAIRDTARLPAEIRESARLAVDEAVKHLQKRAAERTAERYNLSVDTLQQYVVPRRASVTADGARGSVELQVKAIPLSEFSASVRMRPVTLATRSGKKVTRRLPTVSVALYRGQRARQLPGAFPMRQRSDGALFAGEKVRKRIGKDRTKLTGFRYYTFPKRILDKLLPQLQAEGAGILRVSLRAAFRKQFRGLQVLRHNDT